MKRVSRIRSNPESSKTRRWFKALRLVAIVTVSAFGASAPAQDSPTPAAGDEAPAAAAPERDFAASYDSTVPVGAVRAYIDSCRDGDYEAAAGFLVLDSVPAEQRDAVGQQLAARLKIVLDRKL